MCRVQLTRGLATASLLINVTVGLWNGVEMFSGDLRMRKYESEGVGSLSRLVAKRWEAISWCEPVFVNQLVCVSVI